MKLAAAIVLVLAALIAGLWLAFVRAPEPHVVCQRKAEILLAETGGQHGEAVENLLDQYRVHCRKQTEKVLQLRGKLVYARLAKCVMAATTLNEAERCG